MDTDLGQLQTDIDAARAAYHAERAVLVRAAGWVYADGPAAADAMITMADEFGPSKAVEQYLAYPPFFGDIGASGTDQVVADQSDGLEGLLERVLDAHDRLDELTSQREKLLAAREPGRLQVVNFSGREYVVDEGRGEIRSVAEPNDRHVMDRVSGGQVIPGLAPTSQISKELETPVKQPSPAHTRERGR